MVIDFSKIDNEFFYLSKRYLDDFGQVYLIAPKPSKHSWNPDEYIYRSLLCDLSGKVLSSGFKKFLNFGEDFYQDEITKSRIGSSETYFAEKMDGSLIIRSVINNKVHFRTRGSHYLAYSLKEDVYNLVEDKYPNLLNPSIDKDFSLLFEYTGPDNLIVLNYDQKTLTALAKVCLDNLNVIADPEVVLEMEKMYGTPAVKFYSLNGTIEDIKNTVRNWSGREGIVIWSKLENSQTHMAKIKADEYIKIHSIKFQMTGDKIKQLCWIKDIQSLPELKKEFFKLGIDWEIVKYSESIFNEYSKKFNEINKCVENYLSKVKDNKLDRLNSRKEKALALKKITEDKFLFSIGISYLFNNGKDIKDIIGSKLLDMSKSKVSRLKNRNVESL